MHQLPPLLRFLAATISLLAGYVDAIGFVGFGGTFVSFMSGNSTRLGAGLASAMHAPALFTAAVIALFVVGVATGQALGGERDTSRRVRVSLLVAASLALAATLPNWTSRPRDCLRRPSAWARPTRFLHFRRCPSASRT